MKQLAARPPTPRNVVAQSQRITPIEVVPVRDGVVTIPKGALLQLALLFHDIKKSCGGQYAKAA